MFMFSVRFLFSLVLICCCVPAGAQSLRLWYDHPANAAAKDSKNPWESDSAWLQALPVGNGFIGAMVFGDVNSERIQLNEKTLWSGSPADNDNPAAADKLPEIRKLLFDGKFKEADALINKTQICKGKGSAGGTYGCYQTLGDLHFDFETDAKYTNYHRELNLERGLVLISYTQNDVKFKREVFASYPDRALVMRITASKPGAINFAVTMDRPERYKTESIGDQLVMSGTVQDGKGGDGLTFVARLKATADNGDVQYREGKLIVSKATNVTLVLTAGTDYLQKYPDYIGADPLKTTLKELNTAIGQGYSKLLSRHERDYCALFNSVSLHLKGSLYKDMPTDKLLKFPDDLHLYELYFQFGRYLLISSSRPGGLPANLQGIWCNKVKAAWNCDYHTNINLQMNYWPADITNLSECFIPFNNFVSSLLRPGERTATIQYHGKGWTMGPITNIWGYTSPGESPGWGMYVAASGWLSLQLWDHYTFNPDIDYLKKIYPLLVKAAEFYQGWLVPDPRTGELLSGPATSPENSFFSPDGTKGSMSMGPSHDQEIIGDLFTVVLKAANIVHDSSSVLDAIRSSLDRLGVPKIGKDGRIMEWRKEYVEVEPTHRHVSHLFMLYPGKEVDPISTPKLARAAEKVLKKRTDAGTGWSLAWKINFWARLQEGDHAFSLLKDLLHPTVNYKVQMSDAGGTYSNLFCAHPPFQIDRNFGGTAGIAEMLLQSHKGAIQLLPALPTEWPAGNITGLRARGGFEIGMSWENHTLRSATLKSFYGGKCVIRSKVPLALLGQKIVSVKNGEYYVLILNTKQGADYELNIANL